MAIGKWLSRMFRGNREQDYAPPAAGQSGLTGKAILGPSHGPATECATACLGCNRLVVILMPGPPVRGKVAQAIYKHICVHCACELFAMSTPDSRMLLGTHCQLAGGQVQLGNGVELQVLERASIQDGGARLTVIPLVVCRGPDGKPALLTSEDLGLSSS